MTAETTRLRSVLIEFIGRPGNVQRIIVACGILILVSGLCTAILCPWLMKIAFSPTPHADQWAILDDITAGQKWFSPTWLWKQANEHRIPLLRLAICADLQFFGGHGYLLYSLSFVTLLLQWVMWSLFVRQTADLPKLLWMPIAGFFGFCFFCPNQIQNFYSAIQWTFVAEFFFSSAAFIALAWFAQKGRPWRAVGLASLAAFLAEGSLANGNLTWPILWLATLRLPMQRKHRLVLGGTGMAAIALYLYHYWQPSYHSNPLETIRQPYQVAQYVLRYIGHCLSNYFVQAGFIAIVLSVAAFVALFFLLRRPQTHVLGVALTATMCFVLATGAMTGLGRLTLGIEQAEGSRYQTPVMLYWGCAFAALLIAAWQLGSWRDVLALNMAAVAAIFLPFGNLRPLIKETQARADVISLSGESLDRGLVDPMLAQTLVIPISIIIPITRYLHSHGVALGPSAPNLPASVVTSDWKPGACEGWLDAISPLKRFDPGPQELRADGWAMKRQTRRPAESIAIIDNHGTVLAQSSLHFDRPDVKARNPGTHGRVGWHIYVPLSNESRQLRAVAIVDGHGCPLSHVVTIHGEHE
ncbi:MAG: hypothetical protein ACJ74Z_19820 [Bryobacteraceae bacterium]